MSWFNIFTLVKEVNDKMIRIEHENATMKDKITEFDAVFREMVSKLMDRQNAMEKAHIEEIAALKAEVTLLKERFKYVTEQAFVQAVEKLANGHSPQSLLSSIHSDGNESAS